MGTFTTEIEVGDISLSHFETVEVLVDTGATYTMLPTTLLSSLGVTPISARNFVIASGQRIRRDIGQATIQIGDEVLFNLVVFTDDGSPPVLGAFTLEAFGLAADPVNQRLIPVDALAMATRSPACLRRR